MMNPKLKAVHVRISNEKESEDCLDVHFVVLRHTIRLSTGYVVLASWNKEVIYIYIWYLSLWKYCYANSETDFKTWSLADQPTN
jgi:hypothetical protein